MATIQETAEWKDEVSDRLRALESDHLDEEEAKLVLLNTLRRLHAKQAEQLGFLSITNHHTGATFSLISDDQLRNHLGRITGLIAASHHWDIQDLPKRLPAIQGAVAGFPPTWTIQPTKLACLLRCADAAQLDQSRTPDFLYALLRLRGLSETHWRAQNKLATPAIDPQEPEALVFSSTMAFAEKDADAWWVAYDAISIANRELQNSENLLRDLRLPTFAIKRIRDADSPTRLANHLAPEGWRPVSAEVKISRVSHVVRMFGGQELYGTDSTVPLRELIQNAADAIRDRRAEEGTNSTYVGKIVIGGREDVVDGISGLWVEVDDDGLGMSEAVLTGPLIEFGSSYFNSQLMRDERPGLASKRVRHTGRYGIGFFSVFMLAAKVLVSSRPFNGGMSDVRTLSFKDGLSLRPLLLDRAPATFSSSISTRVSIWLPDEKKNELLSVTRMYDELPISLTLAELVGYLCPTLDCDIYVQWNGEQRVKVHQSSWYNEDTNHWLRRITLAKRQQDADLLDYVDRASRLMRHLAPENPAMGLAAVGFQMERAGVEVIGGLNAVGSTIRFQAEFSGALEHVPKGPSRAAGAFVDKEMLARWATEQAILCAEQLSDPRELHEAAANICAFGGDPSPIAVIILNGEVATLNEVCEILISGQKVIAPVELEPSDELIITHISASTATAHLEIRPSEIEKRCVLLTPLGDYSYRHELYYSAAVSGGAMSFVRCLANSMEAAGYCLEIGDPEDSAVGEYTGPSSERDQLWHGTELRSLAVQLSAAPIKGSS